MHNLSGFLVQQSVGVHVSRHCRELKLLIYPLGLCYGQLFINVRSGLLFLLSDLVSVFCYLNHNHFTAATVMQCFYVLETTSTVEELEACAFKYYETDWVKVLWLSEKNLIYMKLFRFQQLHLHCLCKTAVIALQMILKQGELGSCDHVETTFWMKKLKIREHQHSVKIQKSLNHLLKLEMLKLQEILGKCCKLSISLGDRICAIILL